MVDRVCVAIVFSYALLPFLVLFYYRDHVYYDVYLRGGAKAVLHDTLFHMSDHEKSWGTVVPELLAWGAVLLDIASICRGSKWAMFLCDIFSCVVSAMRFHLIRKWNRAACWEETTELIIGQFALLMVAAFGLLVTLLPRPIVLKRAPNGLSYPSLEHNAQSRAMSLLLTPCILYALGNAVHHHGYLKTLPQCIVLLWEHFLSIPSMFNLRIFIVFANVPCLLYGLTIGSVEHMTSRCVYTAFNFIQAVFHLVQFERPAAQVPGRTRHVAHRDSEHKRTAEKPVDIMANGKSRKATRKAN
jgi:hypothetical protein